MTSMSAERAELQTLYAKLREAGMERIHFSINENAPRGEVIKEVNRVMRGLLDGSILADSEIVAELGDGYQAS